MPYIKKVDREEFDKLIDSLITELMSEHNIHQLAGNLNYIITRLLIGTEPDHYHDFNELVGVLECAKLELYRRRIAPYENKKIKENGDV